MDAQSLIKLIEINQQLLEVGQGLIFLISAVIGIFIGKMVLKNVFE